MPGKAEILRKLHQGPRILVLPNAWDVASARIFEEAGFPAIATSSAGVANANASSATFTTSARVTAAADDAVPRAA